MASGHRASSGKSSADRELFEIEVEWLLVRPGRRQLPVWVRPSCCVSVIGCCAGVLLIDDAAAELFEMEVECASVIVVGLR